MPASTPATLDGSIRDPPVRDLLDLQRRLKPTTSPAATRVADQTPNYLVGTEQGFWIANQTTKTYFQIMARVALKTDHAYWYEQDLVDQPIADIQAAASYFESQTYPTEHRLFGSEWSPGIDRDVHITILIGHIPGVGGYFSSADENPAVVNPYSNEREMIYINVDAVRPGSASFNTTVSHEFMHMIQFNVHRDQDSWVNEGSAELAAQAVTGAASSGVRSFEQRPDTQLTAWASEPMDSIPHYGAAYLFMRYVAEHFGGFQAIGKAVAEPGRGLEVFSAFFRSLVPPLTFNQVFGDWIAANELDDPSGNSGKYGYQSLPLHPATQPGPATGESVRGLATQYGVTYYTISPLSNGTLSFAGTPTVALIGAVPHGDPQEWWSNRGDSIDSRLTRSINLSAAKSATLHFWIWYDIEEGYDYGYVEASRDAGKSWVTLAAPDTTKLNPNGQNYGNGFTGTSGGTTPTWVQESVDLSPFAGQMILLRFEYVTDDSYNADGMAIDGVEIPEIGFRDPTSSDNGWSPEGFTRIANSIAEPYLVEALTAKGSPPVAVLPIDSRGRGSVQVTGGQSFVLAVAGLAPLTTHQAAYTLTLTPN